MPGKKTTASVQYDLKTVLVGQVTHIQSQNNLAWSQKRAGQQIYFRNMYFLSPIKTE